MRAVVLLLVVALGGCAWYHEQWRRDFAKNGACLGVCDYYQGYLSAGTALDATHCRCYTPQLREFNQGRQIPLDHPEAVYECYPDCWTVAEHIWRRQPWRRPKF